MTTEVPKSIQQSCREIVLVRARGREVMTTGAGWTPGAGWGRRGCVLVMSIAAPGCGIGRGRTLIRAGSLCGPPMLLEGAGVGALSRIGVGQTRLIPSAPGGLGSGFNKGDGIGADSGAASDVMSAGGRRMGVTGGVRDGRTIRAVSRFSADGIAPACSGRGGTAMRTVSFFGSAMTGGTPPKKWHKGDLLSPVNLPFG